MNDWGLAHSFTISWCTNIADSSNVAVCYECLWLIDHSRVVISWFTNGIGRILSDVADLRRAQITSAGGRRCGYACLAPPGKCCAESHVSMSELAELIHRWPPAVINHMTWRQREIELMRKMARMKFRPKNMTPCTFCGTFIKVDMYRQLAQLWRCPVSWCTVWKGTPQDLMDHVLNDHNVPEGIRRVSLEMLFPPWTVTRQLYEESLSAKHSGISNDVLLFSELGLSLVHHYRVHRSGRPHIMFRGKYLAQLRALLPLKTADGSSGTACPPHP